MRNNVVRSIVIVGFVLAAGLSLVLLAQSPNKTTPAGVKPATAKAGAAKPDLSGVWKARNTPQDFDHPEGPGMGNSGGWRGEKPTGAGYGFLDLKSEEPVMLPWAAARYKALREGSRDNMQPDKNLGPDINCVPGGFPWVLDLGMVTPFEIIQTPNKILMLFSSDGEWRQIYMDGRKNPEGAADTFMGYSTGRWEGDTLVVETTGLNDYLWIDRIGHPHSDALRVEERIRRVAPNRLDFDLLFDDPKTYVKPWKGKKIYFLQDSKVDPIEDFSCETTWRTTYPAKLRKELGDLKGP